MRAEAEPVLDLPDGWLVAEPEVSGRSSDLDRDLRLVGDCARLVKL